MSDVLSLASAALDLAKTAVQADNKQDYTASIDRYELVVAGLDEIMSRIDDSTEEWRHSKRLKNSYDNRIDVLRDFAESETLRNNNNNRFTADKGAARRGSRSSKKMSTFQPISAEVLKAFRDDFEDPPHSILLLPYWQLRSLRKSLLYGAFLYADLLLPRVAWEQDGVRFSGIYVKIQCFKDFSTVIDEHVVPLFSSHAKVRERLINFAVVQSKTLPLKANASSEGKAAKALVGSESGAVTEAVQAKTGNGGGAEDIPLEVLHSMYIAFVSVHSELCDLQNSLTKSFNYIPEVTDDTGTGTHQRGRGSSIVVGSPLKGMGMSMSMSGSRSMSRENTGTRNSQHDDGEYNGGVNDSFGSGIQMDGDGDGDGDRDGDGDGDRDRNGERKSNSADIDKQEEKSRGGGIGGFFARSLGTLGRASSIVSNGATSLVKSVRRTAEVGISRIGALPSKTSKEELLHYGEAAQIVIEKCQLFQQFYRFLEDLRSDLLTATATTSTSTDDDDESSPRGNIGASCLQPTTTSEKIKASRERRKSQSRENDVAASLDHCVSMVEATMTTLLHITRRVKDTLCGMLVRDAQEVHISYMLELQANLSVDESGN